MFIDVCMEYNNMIYGYGLYLLGVLNCLSGGMHGARMSTMRSISHEQHGCMDGP